MKKLYLILGSIFLASTIVMTILFCKESTNHKFAIGFGASCITSFYNAMDYHLCITDVYMGNTRFETCDNYYKMFLDDVDTIANEFPRTGGYNYVGMPQAE